MYCTEPCRFATAERVQWLRSTTFDIAYATSTAVDWPHGLLAPPASMDAHGREVLSPAYWSCLKPYTGQFRAALLRRSACGDCAA